MTFDEILLHLEHDAGAHTTSGPSDAQELERLEAALGAPLPPLLRLFLLRLGGGIFYGKHEIFGAHRVMIHDIELLPSLRQLAAQLARAPAPPPPGWLAFHREGGRLHLIDAAGAVVSWPPGARHAGLDAFLERVVLAGPAAKKP